MILFIFGFCIGALVTFLALAYYFTQVVAKESRPKRKQPGE